MIARHTRGRGHAFNVQKQHDIACRTGNIFQGARQYDKGGYPTTPPPINFLRQGYTKLTPNKIYTSKIQYHFSIEGKPHPRDLWKTVTQGSDATWWQLCAGPSRSKCIVAKAFPVKPLRASRMNACTRGTVYPTHLVFGDHYYRLGSCHAAGRVGKEYEVQSNNYDKFLCIDRHYLLFKITLVRSHAIRPDGDAAIKMDPQLHALVHAMEHPSRHNFPLWYSSSGVAPSRFFALVKIGGVQIQTPPKWWRQHGKCSRSPGAITCASPAPTVPTP
jgi:hypothetical protein